MEVDRGEQRQINRASVAVRHDMILRMGIECMSRQVRLRERRSPLVSWP
jgi:hypothetical protein